MTGWAHAAAVMEPLAARLGGVTACWAPAGLLAEAEQLQGEMVPAAGGPLSPYAAALAARLRQQPGPVVLAGWSLGGLIVLETALAVPECVAGLVLLAATARFCAAEDYPQGMPAANLRALAAGVARAPEAALRGFFSLAARPGNVPEEVLAGKVAAALAQGTAALRHGLDHLRTCDLRSRLAGLAVPVHIIHGRADAVIPAAAADYLAQAIPGARLSWLEGAGHALPETHAGEIAGVIAGPFTRPQ
ncbi:MAG: alpha/beta fold hydrolase [Lentisphaeria bacterium]